MKYTDTALERWDGLLRKSASGLLAPLSGYSSYSSAGLPEYANQTCSCGKAIINHAGPSTQSFGDGQETCPTCGGAGHITVPGYPLTHAAIPSVSPGSPAQAVLGPGGHWDALMPTLLPAGNSALTTATAAGMGIMGGVATRGHGDLVRAVVMNEEVVVSGSYDATIKVYFMAVIFIVIFFSILFFGRLVNRRTARQALEQG